MRTPPLSLSTIRASLAGKRGGGYWRTLEEIAASEPVEKLTAAMYPHTSANRRRFLQLMMATLAAAPAACKQRPAARIVPYVDQPEQIVPGEPLFYATALPSDHGLLEGVLVETHMGRPTRVEGNQLHPASLGAADLRALAQMLTFYDGDRSNAVTYRGQINTWTDLVSALRNAVQQAASAETPDARASSLRILTGPSSSPTLLSMLRTLVERKQAIWHIWDPCASTTYATSLQRAFGRDADVHYDLESARVVVCLDADLIDGMPGKLRYARQLARRRTPGRDMARLYALETTPTLTGALADHRQALRPSELADAARALAHRLGISKAGSAPRSAVDAKLLDAVAGDLLDNPGACVVVAGRRAPVSVQTLALAMNERLGALGTTARVTRRVVPETEHASDLRSLLEAMHGGRVGTLVIVDCNPVYTAPGDLDFTSGLENVRERFQLSLYPDETSPWAHWHAPLAHPFETWGDGRALDGTVSIQQPMMRPLWQSRSALELLAVMTGSEQRDPRALVRAHWKDIEWRRSLHDGLVDSTSLPTLQVSVDRGAIDAAPDVRSTPPHGLEIVFRPDPTIGDGRLANNAWLQELPKPLTRLTWDNALLLSPATAERLGLANEQVVTIEHGARSTDAPVWILPGHPDDTLTVHLGYGRSRAGHVGDGLGFDAYRLQSFDSQWASTGARLTPTARRYPLATTQHHHRMEGRHLYRHAPLSTFLGNPGFARRPGDEPEVDESMFPPWSYEGTHEWSMVIDLSVCTGCGACTLACQTENNIPVVGKEQVMAHREMHWIRVDRYFHGDRDDPRVFHQPVPCMQCELAPCELVCPVGATVHSADGLNDMTYNRCVGTRYCSNNCPYKVRRFNFFGYTDDYSDEQKAHQNPDVTVRGLGVMEKCTYCVQRIRETSIRARDEKRAIGANEISTACQQACPTEAIIFGDRSNADSRAAHGKADPRNYDLLGHLGTRPRTSYLAAVRNLHPDLEGPEE